MNAAAAFVVDPETHQLYVAYGRGHLAQMDRQKLMTGKSQRLAAFKLSTTPFQRWHGDNIRYNMKKKCSRMRNI